MAHAEYLQNIFQVENRSTAIRDFKSLTCGIKYDTIITNSGISGIGFAAPLAFMLNKELWITRKNPNESHSLRSVEYPYLISNSIVKFIYVDDLVDSGKTLKQSMEQVYNLYEIRNNFIKLECMGLYRYAQNGNPVFKSLFELHNSASGIDRYLKGIFD